MKKKMSLLLALLLLAGFITIPVYANDGLEGYNLNYIGTQNSYCSWLVNERSGMAVAFPTYVSWGSVPPGMFVRTDGNGAMYLEGTPIQAGTWNFSQCVVAYNPAEPEGGTWEESYNITVTIESVGTPPVVTKHPAAETVAEKGWTEFIAYASDAAYLRWNLINPAGQLFNAADAASYCPGVIVSGANSEILVFQNVPLSLDNWSVQCVFGNDYGEVATSPAMIHVVRTALQDAVITMQPSNLTLEYGAKGTLTLGAMSPDGNQLSFQWYRNTEASRNGGDAIYGAYGPNLTVDYQPGTVYYYCVIRNVRGDEVSSPIGTELVSVTGKPAPTPAPTPTPTPAPTPTPTPAPAKEADPAEQPATAAPTVAPAPAESSSSLVTVLLAAVIGLGCALIAVLFKKKK